MKEWNTDEARLVSRCASEIEIEPVQWIWPDRIARGKHTSVGGDPGGGKSQLSMFIAGVVSVGGEWPCGEGRSPQGSVIVLSAEDGAADTIVPRLHAAEADCGSVHIVSAVQIDDVAGQRGFNLQADIALLEEKIEQLGDVALVIIDPVSSYLGKTDSHKNAEVRGVLEPLSAMAERTNVAVVSVTHFSKAGAANGAKALHRFIGSIAFVGAPRMAFALIADSENEERRLLLHAKNNLAPPPQGLAFKLRETIVGEPGRNVVTSRVDWEPEPVSISADAALAAGSDTGERHGSALGEAKDFLRNVLGAGAQCAKDVQRQAEEAGIASKTLRRAREQLGVKSRTEGFQGQSVWELPPQCCPSDPNDAHQNNVGKIGLNGQDWTEPEPADVIAPMGPIEPEPVETELERDRRKCIALYKKAQDAEAELAEAKARVKAKPAPAQVGRAANIYRFPKLSAAEEADLLGRWRKHQDQTARKRIIEASLRLVPPIAGRQARQFALDLPSEANKAAIKGKGIERKIQQGSGFRELLAEGNLALVTAFDAFGRRPRPLRALCPH